MTDEEDQKSTIVAVPRITVSYNVSRGRHSESSIVYQYVFGRKVTKRTATGKKVYRYPGLVGKPDVEALGQSVLMMREKDAEDFHAFLWGIRVMHAMMKVWIEP